MRKEVIMRNLYAIILLSLSGILYAQEDSLTVEKDSILTETMPVLPTVPSQDI